MHYEDKKTGFKFDAVSGVPKENTVEAFEELFAANKATEEGELPYGWVYECVQPGTDGKGWSEFFSRNEPKPEYGVRNITPLFSRQVANKAEVEPVAFMTSDKKMLVFADVLRKLQFNPAGMIALYATPPANTGASTVLTDELIIEDARDWGLLDIQDGGRIDRSALISFVREVAAQAGQVAVPEKKHE